MSNRKIYILLSQYERIDAKFLSWSTRFPYSHASLGFEEDMNTFYTFVTKGFLVEKITMYNKPGRESFQCALYELEVTEEVYNKVKEKIFDFKENKENYKYSTLGLIMCYLKIPYYRKDRYFCSHFVADVLQSTGAVKLKKKSTLYFARDISRIEGVKQVYKGTHADFVEKYVNKSENE